MSRIFKYVTVQEKPLILIHSVSAKPELVEQPDKVAESDQLEVNKARDQARDVAAAIIAAAEKEAAKLISEAAQQVEKIRQDAYDEGVLRGTEAGILQGQETGLAQVAKTIAEAASQAERILTTAQAQAAESMLSAENQIIELALAVASKIMAHEINENPMAISLIVQAALARIRDQEQVAIRVNPDDYETLLQARPALQSQIGEAVALTIVADANLKSGDCVLETPYGLIDAKLDSQFEILKTALKGQIR